MPGVTDEKEIAESEARKEARKARPGGMPKLVNLPRNWLHQALSYMDAGELGFRLVIELLEVAALYFLFQLLMPGISLLWLFIIAIIVVHTWNWITNGLFWAVVIFTFPGLKNPGAEKTVEYLNAMAERLKRRKSISGLSVYGSVSRAKWHDRSDIDIRMLRRPGLVNLFGSALLTMRERFIAFMYRQPMDLYLADDADFLNRMRADEVPFLLIKRDRRLDELYPDNPERVISVANLIGEPANNMDT